MKMFGAEDGTIDSDYEEPLEFYIARFKELVQDITDEVGDIGGVKVILSDPNSCFRYDIYPAYKGNRDADARSPLFYRLRDWALKEYGYVENVEADDVVSYFVREKNYIGATMDKDMLRGVAGSWFDTYHSRRTLSELSVDEANKFNLIQTLIGDATDNIKALPKKAGDPMIPVDNLPKGQRQPFKLTESMAIKLLNEFGWNWEGVVKIYESKGFSEKEATLNRQLVCLNQWSPEGGVVLWSPL
jgi:5'-3' exonuclease